MQNTIQKSRSAIFLFSAGLIFLMAACTNLSNDPAPMLVAQITFYHGSPDAPSLQANVDSRPFLTDLLNYSDYTGYRDFWQGQRRFTFNAPNASTALIDTTFNIVKEKTYSIFLIEPLTGIEALLVTDSAGVPSSGKAMVRFVHLSPDSPPMDVVIDGQNGKVFSDVSFKEAAAFREIAAGNFVIQLKDASSSDVLVTTPDLVLQTGKYYTIITRGFKNPPEGNTHILSVQIVENN